MKKTPEDVMEEMLATFKERRAIYGDNWRRIGFVMDALFPEGLTIRGVHMWNRFHLFFHSMTKMTRLAVTRFEHEDSSLDTAVYSAMLTSLNSGNEGKMLSEFSVSRSSTLDSFEVHTPTINGVECSCEDASSKRTALQLYFAPGVQHAMPIVEPCPVCGGGRFII